MLRPTGVHHVAVIASDYARSRRFYTEVLGLQVVHEHYRAERQSYKLDLQLPDGTQIELFSFPEPPARPNAAVHLPIPRRTIPSPCQLQAVRFHQPLHTHHSSACPEVPLRICS